MKISFDFDGTLADDFDGTPNWTKDKVIAKLRELQAEHHDIYIVTKRYSAENAKLGKVNEHVDVFRLAAELGISGQNVVFTNRELKADVLHKLGINQHYENSDIELDYFLRNYKTSSMNFIMVNRAPWKIFNSESFIEETV